MVPTRPGESQYAFAAAWYTPSWMPRTRRWATWVTRSASTSFRTW